MVVVAGIVEGGCVVVDTVAGWVLVVGDAPQATTTRAVKTINDLCTAPNYHQGREAGGPTWNAQGRQVAWKYRNGCPWRISRKVRG